MANLLCPGNIAVSGTKTACERVAKAAEAVGAMKTVPLAVAGAFHTPIMQPAVDRLAAALKDVRLKEPRIPVVSNVDAQPHSDREENPPLTGSTSRQPGSLGSIRCAG